MEYNTFYSGRVSILGKPNSGKSSFFNLISKDNSSIVSHKPQTTRKLSTSIYKDDNSFITFYDTPGYHKSNSKLGDYINYQVRKSLKIQDLVIFLFSINSEINDNDINLLNEIKKYNCENCILFLTKKDINYSKIDLDLKISKLNEIVKFKDVFYVSFLGGVSIREIINLVKLNLPIVNKNEVNYDQKINENIDEDKFKIEELIRSVIIKKFRDEIPYSCSTKINLFSYKEEKKLLVIEADIIVEKESQKPILIGSKGSMIKAVGIESRKLIEDTFDCKIYLGLNVKVKKDWKNNDNFLKELGYKEK